MPAPLADFGVRLAVIDVADVQRAGGGDGIVLAEGGGGGAADRCGVVLALNVQCHRGLAQCAVSEPDGVNERIMDTVTACQRVEVQSSSAASEWLISS